LNCFKLSKILAYTSLLIPWFSLAFVDFKCKFGSATLFSFAPHPRGLCNQHNKQLPVYESVNVSHTPETPIQTQTSFLAMSRSRSVLYKLYVWAPANASCQKCRWCWRLALLPSRCTHQRAAETPPFFWGQNLTPSKTVSHKSLFILFWLTWTVG